MGRIKAVSIVSNVFYAVLVIMAAPGISSGAKISDIRNTRHNLSSSGLGTVKAVSETEICVFCHTPHHSENIPGAPLWNRKLSGATYTPYTSGSLDTIGVDQPDGSSKLCLSCHDGTLAIGAVNVLNGAFTDKNPSTEDIQMQGVDTDRTIAVGQGSLTGFTRDLGTILTNDHPISFTYDTNLSIADGELNDPALSPYIATRNTGNNPLIPLEPDSFNNPKLQCISCHDPHIRDDSLTPPDSGKFLRLNRLQANGPPTAAGFNPVNDIVCLGCHDKKGWIDSAHASDFVATQPYSNAAATLREFPAGTMVWEASCLNCHDTHTVQGARRLLREGTDSISTPKSGGNSAIEEACYQCHSALGTSILADVNTVPDIKTDFSLQYHMPITSLEQLAGTEMHDINDADFTEQRQNMGFTNLFNRHAECTDCHNPHRVIKNRLFSSDPVVPDVSGTHPHNTVDLVGGKHTNIISGVLAGSAGVEPVYSATDFGITGNPTSFITKSGYGGVNALDDVNQTFVTREYQICLKCHSNYAYGDQPPDMPELNLSGPGTPQYDPLTSTGIEYYTNQAMELQAPLTHKGEVTATGTGAAAGATCVGFGGNCDWVTNNHRSWHPVMDDTGRTNAIRTTSISTWVAPWDAATGTQTMYCTDCHGSSTLGATVEPSGGEDGNPWGPHGSSNRFLLKGTWDKNTGFAGGVGCGMNCSSTNPGTPGTATANALCLKCHAENVFLASATPSGFCCELGPGGGNLHAVHNARLGGLLCSWCHAAVPHGWKNKALLVNLNDVGAEGGLAPGTHIPDSSIADPDGYNNPPYYQGARLKIKRFAASGQWQPQYCGDSGFGFEGFAWMQNTCAAGL
ncbi:MAG: hypothetical protein ACE5EN_02350 [Nitrospinota bacterium]